MGNAIKALRLKQNMSQKTLAQKSELHINTISALEVGGKAVKLTTLFFVAKGLNVNLHDIVRLFYKNLK